MAKPEWGIKRTCQVCGKKYYDLNKSPIICPCPEAVEFDPNHYLRTRKGKSVPLKASTKNDNDLTEDIEDIENIRNIETIKISIRLKILRILKIQASCFNIRANFLLFSI